MTLFDRLRPYLARIIGTLVGAIAAYVLVHFHIVVNSKAQEDLVELILQLVGLVLVLREATHETLNKRINPSDSASAHLAVVGKREKADAQRAIDAPDEKPQP